MTEQHEAHNLLPDEIAASLPPLYSTDKIDDPIVTLKWFTPDSSWTWYVLEFDPTERLCFGVVVGHQREHGYFSLDEIEQLRGPFNLPVERDLHWKPTPVSKCR